MKIAEPFPVLREKEKDLRARRNSRSQAATPASAAKLLSVHGGQRCVGFILMRAKDRFEAFDTDERSVGVFASTREAAAAISAKEMAT